MNIIVVGAGSVGRRHITNLQELGYSLTVVDTNFDRLKRVAKNANIRGYSNFQVALQEEKAEAVFICVPTHLHIKIALTAAEYGCHIFMEKPLSHNLEGVYELLRMVNDKNLVLYVNYNMRFHPGIKKMKSLIEDGEIGRPLYIHAECGQYLPDWHPYESYKNWYMSRKEQGGGAILDISHEIDYVRWIMGGIKRVLAMVETVSLDMDADDCSDLLLEFESGARGHIHLDLLNRVYRRQCTVVGEDGTLTWDYNERCVKIFEPKKPIVTFSYSLDRNQIFIKSVRHFFECVSSGKKPLIDGNDALKTLNTVLAANFFCKR
jgi:predicted dehydrogenase